MRLSSVLARHLLTEPCSIMSRLLDLVGPSHEKAARMIEPVFNQRLREMEKAGKDWTAKEERR